LNPFPPNDVLWTAGVDGLRFGPRGIVVSSRGIEWPNRPATTPCSIESWLQPDRNPYSSDILNFYAADRNLRLFQWSGTTLLLYEDVDSHHEEIDIENALPAGVPVFVSIVGGPGGTSVYLNGELSQRSQLLRLTAVDCSGRLVLGTSPFVDTAWRGQIRSVAIYTTELTAAQVREHFAARNDETILKNGGELPAALYNFVKPSGREIQDQVGASPSLYLPAHFTILHKSLLLPPWKDLRWSADSLLDIFLNVAGFVSLGCVLSAYFRIYFRRAPLYALLFGVGLSLAIEMAQIYLPTRTSSLGDVLMNTIGLVLGIISSRFFESLADSLLSAE
jgi:hypothetical protein